MERRIGTEARGIRAPIIREGDDIVAIVVDSVLDAAAQEGFALRDRDVIAVTEAVVGRAQGNYATIEHITMDVRAKLARRAKFNTPTSEAPRTSLGAGVLSSTSKGTDTVS